MKQRPILFNAAMVRALLNGSKTQTRRLVPTWQQPKHKDGEWMSVVQRDPRYGFAVFGETENICAEQLSDTGISPYGIFGDQLWVRETFQPLFADEVERYETDYETGKGFAVRYPATDEIVEWVDGDDNITSRCTPSIHMPRWASRITLEITSVRVERLKDISEKDAKSEGIEIEPGTAHWKNYDLTPGNWRYWESPIQSFRTLWDSINGAESWEANPWVWVIEFKRVEQ